jgi:manganese/zinc/iron transport system permease protein
MFLGALAAGLVTTILIELIHGKSRVKQDAAIGITFSSLFALGVILISLYADKVDLDTECVLYGEIGFVSLEPPAVIAGLTLGPASVVRMAGVTVLTVLLITLFYKELLVSSFDPGLAVSLGINATAVHYGLMCLLSIVVVSAFESVGAILVISMLILPGATAALLSQRLPVILALTVGHGALSTVLGLHLALWLECSIAGAMVVMGTLLFILAWFSVLLRDCSGAGFVREWRFRSTPAWNLPDADQSRRPSPRAILCLNFPSNRRAGEPLSCNTDRSAHPTRRAVGRNARWKSQSGNSHRRAPEVIDERGINPRSAALGAVAVIRGVVSDYRNDRAGTLGHAQAASDKAALTQFELHTSRRRKLESLPRRCTASSAAAPAAEAAEYCR